MISGVHLYMEYDRLTVYVLFTDVEHCASNDFRCLYMDGCVPPSKVCDGKYDCLDASDEMGCDISTPKTPGTTTAGDNPCSKRTFNTNCTIFHVTGFYFLLTLAVSFGPQEFDHK